MRSTQKFQAKVVVVVTILGMLVFAMPAMGQITEYVNQGPFAASAGTLKVINFDSLPAANSGVTGTEFTSQGLTIVQRDGNAINVVRNTVPSSYGPNFVTLTNISSAPNAISSSIFTDNAVNHISDNFDFVFGEPVRAAGLVIGNLAGAVVEILDSAGAVLASEVLSTSHAGIIFGTVGVAWDNRIFYGVISGTPIARIRVTNPPFDGDGITFDDIQWAPFNQAPIAKAKNVIVAAGASCTAPASIDDGSFDPEGGPVSLTQNPPGPYSVGTTNVTLTATDSSGATATATATVTVVDTTAPQFTSVPSPLNVEATSLAGTPVNIGMAAAGDNCGSPNVTSDAPSLFPIGITTVTFTATDGAGNTATATTTVTVVVKQVQIDIKPGSYPNSINLGSNGSVPVAIFSSSGFDASQLDPIKITLAGATVSLKGKGTPMSSLQDVNQDGLPDLVVHVNTEALQLCETDTQAVLNGVTFAGKPVTGSDSVRVVP